MTEEAKGILSDLPVSSYNASEISRRASGKCLDTEGKTLEQRIQELEDIQAIRNLKFAYWDAVDSKDWERFAQVFTEDVDYETLSGKPVHGREQMVAINVLPDYVKTIHQGHQSFIELTSETTARGTTGLNGIVYNAKTSAEFRCYGYYDDEYVKIDGQWYISKMRQRYNMTEAQVHRNFADKIGTSQSVLAN